MIKQQILTFFTLAALGSPVIAQTKANRNLIGISTTPISIFNTDGNVQVNTEYTLAKRPFSFLAGVGVHTHSFSPILNNTDIDFNQKHSGVQFALAPRFRIQDNWFLGISSSYKRLRTSADSWITVPGQNVAIMQANTVIKQRLAGALVAGISTDVAKLGFFAEFEIRFGWMNKWFLFNGEKVSRPATDRFELEAPTGSYPYLGSSARVGYRF